MTPREQSTIDLALQILREALDAKDTPKSATGIRLALRVLLPHCPEKWPLTQFWEGVNNSHEIGRQQTMNASLNGIMVQLRKRGWRG